jgi:hypothetical protein
VGAAVGGLIAGIVAYCADSGIMPGMIATCRDLLDECSRYPKGMLPTEEIERNRSESLDWIAEEASRKGKSISRCFVLELMAAASEVIRRQDGDVDYWIRRVGWMNMDAFVEAVKFAHWCERQ